MFQKKYVIFDFGSENIAIICAQKAPNRTFKMLYMVEKPYDGFSKCKFNNPTQLKMIIEDAIVDIKRLVGTSEREIIVGVPTDFCKRDIDYQSVDFGRRKKIKDDDLIPLFSYNSKKSRDPNLREYTYLSCSSISFELDGGKVVTNAVGEVSSIVRAKLSNTYCLTSIYDMLKMEFDDQGFDAVIMLNSLVETNYLLSAEDRQTYKILLDVGYNTTTVLVAHGDGIEFINCMPLGGNNINIALRQNLELNNMEAEYLKRRAILTFDPNDDSLEYSYSDIMGGKSFSANTVNTIITEVVKYICLYVNKCLNAYDIKGKQDRIIYLTGGGLSYLQGIKQVLGNSLNMGVEILAPNVPGLNKPHLSSRIAMLQYAIDRDKVNEKFFKKLFGI